MVSPQCGMLLSMGAFELKNGGRDFAYSCPYRQVLRVFGYISVNKLNRLGRGGTAAMWPLHFYTDRAVPATF